MSSLWGLTEIVLEGEAANDVYALLSRAKEECASEERDHCSEVIHTVKGDFCFALGLENIYEDTGDDYWGPAVKETVLREDVFMLFAYPFDSSSRHLLDVGRIEYQYDGTVLRINEDTYADEGTMLTFLYAHHTTSARQSQQESSARRDVRCLAMANSRSNHSSRQMQP